jgi:AraC-like DNA-binding protein
MIDSVHAPATRSGYSDPRTPHGVAMGDPTRPAGGYFVLHEVGWLPQGLTWHFPGVLSPFWRLYHNPRPGWSIRHRGRAWPLAPEQILLIPDGTMFDCEGEAGIPHLWIHFGLGSPLRQPPIEPVAQPLTPALDALAGRLIDRLDNGESPAVLAHTASALLHETFANLDPSTLAAHPEKLAAVLALIDRDLTADLSNAALARRAGLSEGAFIRWFHAGVGVTPAVHVQRTRMKTAAHALLTTPRSIDDVAASVGFRNRHHFTRVFTQHFHRGPAAYRRL